MGQLKFFSFPSMKRQRDAILHRNLMIHPGEEQDRYQPATIQALHSCIVAADLAIHPWGAGETGAQTDLFRGVWNLQQQADGGNAQSIISTAAGTVITTSADDNEGTQLRTSKTFTPATGMRFNIGARLQVASLETRIMLALGVKNADPIANLGTAATITDIIAWHMDADPGDGVLTTGVRGNEGTIANGTDLSAVTTGQDFELGITGVFGASASGEFWYSLNPGVNEPKLTKVAMTANQLTQFQAIMTSAPTTMCGTLQALNTAGTSRAVTVKDLWFYVERA